MRPIEATQMTGGSAGCVLAGVLCIVLTGCTVGDRFLGRVCVLSFRTRQAQIDACVEDVEAEAAAIRRLGQA